MTTSAPHDFVPHGVEELRTYGEGFAGREAELAALDRAWNTGQVRVFVLHAEGGAGKTRIVAKWLNQMRDDGWRGAWRVYVHSFYSQGSDERRNGSADLFFEEALKNFGHAGPRLTDPTEQGRTLAQLLNEHRGLLVLDGLEPLQHPPSFDQGRLKDPAIHSLLLSLALGRMSSPSGPEAGGLCLVTSRQPIVELRDKEGRAVMQQPLDRLDPAAGAELLRQLEVRGPERELREAVEAAHGHAYSLMLLGTYLRDATEDHEIRRRHEIPLLDQDDEHRFHARHLFAAYEKRLGESSAEVAVLRLLGFLDRPADEELLAVLREADEPELSAVTAPLRNLSPADWRRVLRRLTELRLIEVPVSPTPPIDSHPLLRECFAEQVRTLFPEAWRAGHRRLFEHLCETTEHQPATLAGLQPLYQAVAHGCLAGLHQQACDEVYYARILRGTQPGGFYSTKSLGALGADLAAVTCFFVAPWASPEPSLTPSTKMWLFNEAATRLGMLGRLAESGEPLRASLDLAVEQNDWPNASICAYNLNETKLKLGEIGNAISAGRQAVEYADRSDEHFSRIGTFAALGHTLHTAGRGREAQLAFAIAELRHGAPLFSIWGFYYCDLLLSDSERSSWRCFLALPTGAVACEDTSPNSAGLLASCEDVTKRASLALRWLAGIPNEELLGVAVENLTLARATLYKGLLATARNQAPSNNANILIPNSALDHIIAAIDGLRRSGQMLQLPHGLLTRAWLRFLEGDETGCRADLDEAWEIAERGPMPLLQADIQLTRARLFRDRAALAEARRLIEKHGYHRRDGELADAEEAAHKWEETKPIKASESLQAKPDLRLNEGSIRDQVFISYSRRDKKFMEELLTHLKPYLRSGSVSGWCDKDIVPGSRWFDEMQTALSKTSVAVLLVSPDFLASDFIHEHEFGPLLKEAKTGGVKILWVPLRASAYEETPLKGYLAVSSPDKPLVQMSKVDRDEEWVRICKEIKVAVNP